MRFALQILAALTLLPPVAVAQVATPAALGPDRIERLVNAMVADKLAKSRASNAPSASGLAQIELAQMVRPTDLNVLRQVAWQAQGNRYSLRQYQTILEFLPNDPIAAFGVAELMAGEGYHRIALPYYARVAAAYPDNTHYAYRAGINAFFAGDYAACVTHLDAALRNTGTPNAGDQYLKRAECHALQGNKADAKRDFASAYAEFDGNGNAWSTLMFKDGGYEGCRGSADSRTANSIKQRQKSQRYKAYLEATIALQCDPNHIGALEAILALEVNDSNLKGHAKAHAIRLADVRDGGKTSAAFAAPLKPMTTAEMLREGEAIDLGPKGDLTRKRRAVYLATRILMVEPGNLDARMLRASALANLNIPALSPMSWDDATRVMRARPDRAAPHDIRAAWLERSGDHPGVLVEMGLAIGIKPNVARYYLVRGGALAELGRYGPALVDMTSAIRLEPRNFFALMRRGETHLLTKNFAAAQADFEAAALIEPKNILPRVGMIRMADLMGQTAKADEMHLALLRTSEFADHNPYLVSRGKPFVAQVTRERSDNAQAARKRSADAEFDAIRGQWNPLVKCHADNLELLARASDAMGAGGSKTAWAPSISSANTPCYERASALSARAGTFRYSAAYGLLSTARQAALDELIPAIEQALADLLRARRLFGLYVK